MLANFTHRRTGRLARPRRALALYARWPGVRGCVTRLLNGRGCNAASRGQHPPSVGDVALARARLRADFAFVRGGLAEARAVAGRGRS